MKNRKKKILDMYFVQKLKPVDIAKKLNIAKSSVTRVLQKDRRYMKSKQERKAKNRQKHIKETKDYIKAKRKINQFKNNADDLILKNMHNQASVELSKPRKLSNMAYRNWNKSAFTYNEKKKRFEFREELGRSYDVPKYIKVEVL